MMGTPLHVLFPLLIPIVAIVMGIGIGMLSLLLDYRKKRDIYALHHKERLAAIEKGIEVPPLPAEFFEDSRKGRRRNEPLSGLRSGLVWLFVGIALCVALYATHPDRSLWTWGLLPIAGGLAKLLYYKLAGPMFDAPRAPDDQAPRPGA
jgi:hypothetical protein